MEKPVLKSMTIWGTIITAATAVVPVVSKLLGHEVSPAEITQVGEAGVAVINGVGSVVGTFLIIWGRFRATLPLKLA